MNTPQEHTLDDATVIARLRSALDEVTAESVATRPLVAPGGRSTIGAGRWLAIAAAIALVGGGITAIVVNRNQHTAAPTDSTPVTPPVPTEPTLVRTVVPWFVLNSPDLQRGEEQFEQCCDPNANLVMAWRNGDQYLTMTEAMGDVLASADTGRTVVQIDGGFLLFDSVGLTDDERDTLARAVVPGSGVPYVLPMEGWAMVGFGYADSGSQRSQLYTALNQPPESSLLPTATITVGEYRGELEWVATFTFVEPTTIAGYDGWKLTNRDGSVIVVWRTDDGSWATLRIDAALAERTDGLIAAVSEVPQGDDPSVDGGPDPVVETVPVPPSSEVTVGAEALGQLQIPSIGLDLVVVTPGSSVDDAKKMGPVLVAGPLPGDISGANSILFGERTTYGAPFERLDELQPGDTITWTDERGTLTFEVVSVQSSDDPDARPAPDGTTLQLRTSDPKYTSQQVLVVYARTVA